MDHEPDVRGIGPSDDLRTDDLLGPVIDRAGEMRLEPADDFFQRFVRSIIRQQVSMAAATAIEDRLAEVIEITPPAILATDETTLLDAGLSAQKAATVTAVAERFDRGDWIRTEFETLSNETVIDALTSVRGVGIWTAKMQLLFTFARRDVFPVEDLGIRRGMIAITGNDLNRAEMRDVATRWAPERSVASLYLWEVVD